MIHTAPPASVTADLLRRYTAGWPADRARAADAGRHLVVAYARVREPATADPRAAVLRPQRVWDLPPTQTFGAGRSPAAVDVALPLVEDDGTQDDAVPRLAVRLEFRSGHWWVTNHATGSATVTVCAPGVQEELSSVSPPHPLRRRRATVTVRARAAGPSGPVPVEHRLHVVLPWIPDDVQAAPRAGDPAPAATTTYDAVSVPAWSWAHQRLLAAWAYGDLIGLAATGTTRGAVARIILGQPLTGPDPNERVLNGLRRRASRELGMSLAGEARTPAFLSYVVARRAQLAGALSALHAEYDAAHP